MPPSEAAKSVLDTLQLTAGFPATETWETLTECVCQSSTREGSAPVFIISLICIGR